MKSNILKSDAIGIIASTLCMIHCVVTPFLFLAKTCSAACCSEAPIWWRWVDIAFLVISFFAIRHAVRFTSKDWMKYAMWTSWSILLFIIVNDQFSFVSLSSNAIYFPALSLVALHFYNLKYCSCATKSCCIN